MKKILTLPRFSFYLSFVSCLSLFITTQPMYDPAQKPGEQSEHNTMLSVSHALLLLTTVHASQPTSVGTGDNKVQPSDSCQVSNHDLEQQRHGENEAIHAFWGAIYKKSVSKLGQSIQRCLDLGIGLRLKNKKGNSPLHTAIQNGSMSMVELLLPYSDLNATNALGLTPLAFAHYLATQQPRKQNTRSILENIITLLTSINRARRPVGNHQHVHPRPELPKPKPEQPGIREKRILADQFFSAIRMGKPMDVIEKFIIECRQNGINTQTLRSSGNTLLHSAIYAGDLSVVEILLKHNVVHPSTLNYRDRTPFQTALQLSEGELGQRIIHILMRYRYDYDQSRLRAAAPSAAILPSAYSSGAQGIYRSDADDTRPTKRQRISYKLT